VFGSHLQATTSDNVSTSFTSPSGVGDNGHWKANETMSLDALDDVKLLTFCFVSSGAVTFLHYQDTGCPTASPGSSSPSGGSTSSPTGPIPDTPRPSKAPAVTSSPTSTPSHRPVAVTASPITTPTTCAIDNTICDFSTLLPGVALSDAIQAQRLLDGCSMSVTAINTAQNNPVNVFNSSQILGYKSSFDPDLGSPNEFCPGGGPGRGVGGMPDSSFRKWISVLF
jgi:hypothetical protein